MGEVRPLTSADLPALAPVHVAAFGHIGNTLEEIHEGYEVKLPELVLNDPFADRAAPSLVFEHDGRVIGFVIVTCRPVTFRDARVWMASTTHLAVEPDARASLAAIHLMRAVADGPQDLTYNDRSNAAGRRALRAAGFEQMPAYSLQWEKTLRPAASIAGRVEARLPFNARFLVAASERAAPHLPGPVGRRAVVELPPRTPALTGRPLTIDDVVTLGPRLVDGYELHPDLGDRAIVEHGWNLTERACPNSTIVRVALTSRRGDVIGWYIVEIGRVAADTAKVLQFAVPPEHQLAAMTWLLHDMYERGVVTARGDLPLRLLYDAEMLGCRLSSHDSTTSVDAADDDLLDVFRRGRAWLSAIEGELVDLPAAVVR